jgi:hypothetical protein
MSHYVPNSLLVVELPEPSIICRSATIVSQVLGQFEIE